MFSFSTNVILTAVITLACVKARVLNADIYALNRIRREDKAYEEHIAPKHGGNGGTAFTIICPNNGVITGINVRSGRLLDQITFICMSSTGTTTFGPYGGTGGNFHSYTCPTNQYISSVYGKSDKSVDKLGVRCRPMGDMISNGVAPADGIFGGNGGSDFNDLSYSLGFRPVAIKVYADKVVDSIQVTYGNSPVNICSANCNTFQEEWASQHGGTGGTLNSFVCPNEGVLTGIDGRSGSAVDQIKFTCTSPLGHTTFGPYGGSGGNPFSDHCPTGYYIDSIHGRSGKRLDRVGIRCVKNGAPTLQRDGHGGNGGTDFDDELNARGNKRPVEIRIYAGSRVDGVQIKYGNLPVVLTCQISGIEVIDHSLKADYDGMEVIGVNTGFSCSNSMPELSLTASKSHVEGTGVDVTEGSEVNWATTVSLSFTYGVEAAGVTTEVTVGLEQTVGGSKSWTNSKSTSIEDGDDRQHGISFPYQAPGAGLIVGYLNRYKINKDNIPVRYKFSCLTGTLADTTGKIKLTSTTFSDTKMVTYAYQFDSVDKCSDAARICVMDMRTGTSAHDQTILKDQFYKCFPAGSGVASHK